MRNKGTKAGSSGGTGEEAERRVERDKTMVNHSSLIERVISKWKERDPEEAVISQRELCQVLSRQSI